MKTKAVEREKVGLLLAQGHTKKEIASILGKSFHTVNMQTRRLYETTHSRNVADLTRYVVRRYSGVPVEDIIINALHDLSLMVAGGLLFYILSQPSAHAELSGAFSTLFEMIREQFRELFYKPPGTF